MATDDQQPIEPPARLGPVPAKLTPTRVALHRLAEQVISPARREATGKIGLRATPGGFGTPVFGDGRQVRVEGTALVVVEHGRERRREALDLDPAAVAFLADWYAFAADVLLALRADAGDSSEPSLVQLWPEHFDIAVELGLERTGARATYGGSPGDETHPEPYLYVAPWAAPEPGELWQATGFNGAELGYAALLDAEDQRATALEFFGLRLAALS